MSISKKVNGELKLTLEEMADYIPTDAHLQVSGDEKFKNISLSTLDGKLVSDNVSFEKCAGYETRFTCIKVEDPGKYIATVQFATGENVRYAIEANVPEMDKFYYDMKTLRERTTYVFDVEKILDWYDYYDKKAAKKIGKHTVLTPNASDIASITRDPGTNVFRVTAKTVGVVKMGFENSIYGRPFQPGDGMTQTITGMKIEVQEMYGLINITPSIISEVNPDM